MFHVNRVFELHSKVFLLKINCLCSNIDVEHWRNFKNLEKLILLLFWGLKYKSTASLQSVNSSNTFDIGLLK